MPTRLCAVASIILQMNKTIPGLDPVKYFQRSTQSHTVNINSGTRKRRQNYVHDKATRDYDSRKKQKEQKKEQKRTSQSATRLYTGRVSGVTDTGVTDTGAVLQVSQTPHSGLQWAAYPGPSGLAVGMHKCQKGTTA